MTRLNPTPFSKKAAVMHANGITPERVQAIQRREMELNRIMPKVSHFGSLVVYHCKKCGGAVFDRNKHLAHHQGEMFHETLMMLFGEAEEE